MGSCWGSNEQKEIGRKRNGEKTVALWRFLSAVSILYVRVYTHRYLGFYKRRDIILWRTGGPPAPQYSCSSNISTVLQDSIIFVLIVWKYFK